MGIALLSSPTTIDEADAEEDPTVAAAGDGVHAALPGPDAAAVEPEDELAGSTCVGATGVAARMTGAATAGGSRTVSRTDVIHASRV